MNTILTTVALFLCYGDFIGSQVDTVQRSDTQNQFELDPDQAQAQVSNPAQVLGRIQEPILAQQEAQDENQKQAQAQARANSQAEGNDELAGLVGSLLQNPTLLMSMSQMFLAANSAQPPAQAQAQAQSREEDQAQATAQFQLNSLLGLVVPLLQDSNTLASLGRTLLASLSTDFWLKTVAPLIQLFKELLLLYANGIVTPTSDGDDGASEPADGDAGEAWIGEPVKEFLPPFTALDFVPIRVRDYLPKSVLVQLSTIGKTEFDGMKSIYLQLKDYESWPEFERDLKKKAPNLYTALVNVYEEGKSRFSNFHQLLNDELKGLVDEILEMLRTKSIELYEAYARQTPANAKSAQRAMLALAPELGDIFEHLERNRAIHMSHLRADETMRGKFAQLNAQLEGLFEQITKWTENGGENPLNADEDGAVNEEDRMDELINDEL